MKKVLLLLAVTGLLTSCTLDNDEIITTESDLVTEAVDIKKQSPKDVLIDQSEEAINHRTIDKDFPCTPSDRNCDGIPDKDQ